MTIIDNLVRTIKASGKKSFSQDEILEMLVPLEREALTSRNITIDPKINAIIVNEKEYVVTRKMFELSYYLLSNKNKIVKRKKILNDVWGNDIIVEDRTIDVHVRQIRRITGDIIKTAKGIGYGWIEN